MSTNANDTISWSDSTTSPIQVRWAISVVVAEGIPVHLHRGNRPGKLHLCNSIYTQDEATGQPLFGAPTYTSRCGRFKDVEIETCKKDHTSWKREICKDCQRKEDS